MLNNDQKKRLLHLARESIASVLEGRKINVEEPIESVFWEKGGVFVTLEHRGNLRGCIGYIKGYKSVWQSIIEMAKAAAFHDSRFRPITLQELNDITIEISLLSELVPVSSNELEQIEVGRDGLYIEGIYGSGLLLPQVAVEWGWDRVTFLRETCRKAGLGSGCYSDERNQVYRFTAEIFSDTEEN